MDARRPPRSGGQIRVLFAGGGTGGHLMPAINIAIELRRQDSQLQALFVGRKDGMEKAIVEKFGFEIREIEIAGLKRNPLGIVRFIHKWRKGLSQAKRIMAEFKPALVVGTGGYVSAPAVRAARKAGIPVFLQEQNSLPGLATRTLSRYAERVFIAYENATRYIDKGKCQLVGNPVRPDLLDADRDKSYAEFGLDYAKKTLLVVGGSSGARGVNYSMLDIIRSNKITDSWQVLWQTGQKDYIDISQALAELRFSGKHLAFIFNMPAAYAVADLIVCRAGAMTLAEIAVWGLPSILIPYPYATGDHQTRNAMAFAASGAAIVIPESEMVERLPVVLSELMTDDQKRKSMAAAARAQAKPDAAGIIAKSILERINAV
ncbi:MAG: undecaprenyldiphospho-muramoylpentapeptide beta-N-acetylglucosaminyltransferase [candidate division Zixibacteria bacterium RBG_16_53_22]|nr:MAG: undecaprenyldiphospho-muramoylpentapeptide beta-N-acetylglucosaminyltransferase [candidate division Zixibacteria bacterium RBG_16_53_22]